MKTYICDILLVTLPMLPMFLWLVCYLSTMVSVVCVSIDLSVTMVTLVTKVSNVPQLCYYRYKGYLTTHSRIIFLVLATF